MQGFIVVHSFTSPNENILKYKPLLIKTKIDGYQELKILEQKKHHNRLIVLIADCKNLQDASQYVNQSIYIDYELLPKLEENSYYWQDIIGLQVLCENKQSLGYISYIIETGSNDILVIEVPKTILIPFILNQAITSIDLDEKKIYVKQNQIIF